MRTSHVGSFPVTHRLEYIERIILDMASIGLDVAPYPQMRSFIEIYLDPLVEVGILEKRGDLFIASLEALEVSRAPEPSVPEAEATIKIVRERKLGFSGLRAPVTGPFTLASRVYLGDPSLGLSATALARPEIVRSFFVPYVAKFVEYLSQLGYTVVFVDEPVLGIVVGRKRILFGYREEDIVEILDRVLSFATERERGIHACGAISPKLFEVLCSVPKARYLNFEFHDTPQNLNTISRELLERYDKVLAPGVASSRKPVIESVDEVKSLLEKVMQIAGGRIDLVSADCGFAGLRGALPSEEECYRVAIEKLKRIVEAVKTLSSS